MPFAIYNHRTDTRQHLFIRNREGDAADIIVATNHKPEVLPNHVWEPWVLRCRLMYCGVDYQVQEATRGCRTNHRFSDHSASPEPLHYYLFHGHEVCRPKIHGFYHTAWIQPDGYQILVLFGVYPDTLIELPRVQYANDVYSAPRGFRLEAHKEVA